VSITASSDVTREWKEYERTSTAVLNSYVQPQVASYVNELEKRLNGAGLAGPLQVMQSNAGTATASAARERPIYLVESGPAGGVVGAARVGERISEPDVLYLDIGGTTAKCSLILGGEPTTTTEYKIEWRPDHAGYPVMVPVVDIVEIGAGGGSIAWVDEGGSLRVGPRSAGAEPGPACYGRGGDQPTVTDAKLLAGVLDADYFLGGEVPVSVELAEAALARLGKELGYDARELANGIVRLLNANMINALKLVSVRRGYDPRDFVLVAGGGGGPMHAAALAAELRVKRVVVPPFSGVFSAWGMCLTDPRIDVIQTRIMRSSDVTADELEALFAGLEEEARQQLVRDQAATEATFARSVDMRYDGQEHAVRVTSAPNIAIGAIVESFHAEHRRAYTFDLPDTAVEFVTFHVAAFGARDRIEPRSVQLAASGTTPTPKGRRAVDFDIDGVHDTPVYEREELPVAFTAAGPLVVEEPTTTTLVHPGQTLEVDEAGNLVIELE
ncbi:MAG: hydantoinase/oxoprolinase family protein, partial [Gaiellaceae bacterium]